MSSDAHLKDHEIIQQLAQAVSLQARLTNRLWLASVMVSFVAVFPNLETSSSGQPQASLPFGLGEVPSTTFFPIAFLILAVLLLGLASAHAQQLRAANAAYGALRTMPRILRSESASLPAGFLFDILREPSLTRVAPLAELAGGRDHSSNHPAKSSWRSRWLGPTLYTVLKTIALAVFFLLPMGAFLYSYAQVLKTGLHGALLIGLQIVGAFALLALLLILWAEVAYSRAVMRHLHAGPVENQA